MLSQVISASRLYQIVASPTSDNDAKLRSINELKTHVKKDFVDIKQVPKYVEALSIAVDISDTGILTSSFSVLSHLVKRVSMQDSSGEVLKSQSYLVLPIIINRLGDIKASARISAKKALEAYWFSAPKEVEDSIIDIAFSHKNLKVINESIIWLDHIITNVNPHFKINLFLPHIVKLLRLNSDSDEVLIENIKTLFKDYYSLKHNRLYKFDLSKEFDTQKIPSNVHESIISQIGTSSSILMKQATPDIGLDHNFILAGTTRVTVNLMGRDKGTILSNSLTPASLSSSTMSRPKSRTNFHNYTKSILPSQEDEQITKPSVHNSAFNKYNTNQMSAPAKPVAMVNENSNEINSEISPEIEKIIAKTFTYKIDSSILPLDVKDVDDLCGTINELLPIFEGKETEFNWGMREKNIIKLRSIIRGNSSRLFTNDLTSYLKESSESICKAVTSLRTTLSSHGCHFLKECAIILKEHFDPLVDSYVPHLMKLCSATKHIASSNANMALYAIFINVPYNYRLLHKILVSANEKNVQPRSYSGIWLQVVLVRFHDTSSFSYRGSNSISGLDTSIKILTKLLADPNPNVRQVAKDTYWCFWDKFPSEAESLLTRLDTNVVKAIERSKPRTITSRNQPSTLSSLTARKARPSIKESIIARNKELRKQKDQTSISRPSSRINSTSSPCPPDNDYLQKHDKPQFSTLDSGKFSRLGVAKRTPSTSSLSRVESNQDAITRKVSDSVSSNAKKHNDSQGINADAQIQNIETMKSTYSVDDNSSNRTNMEQTNKFESFDKQSDPILKFLSSNQKEFITEGINLLKYAIMGEEDLSSEVNGLLKKISVRNQDLLKPLFLSTDNLFKKTYQFFLFEDFFRVCCILIHTIDTRLVDLIVSIAGVDDIYESAIKLISYTTNLGNIIDDSDLTMQIIRFKSIIVRLIIEFLNQGLDKIPISDSYFLKLVTNLFELVSLVKSTGLYKSFCELLIKLYSINPTLFTSELQMIATSTREEVEYVVGIDDVLDLNRGHAINFTTQYELTRVVPGNNLGKMSPLKAPSDLTMVVPVEKELFEDDNIDIDSKIQSESANDTGFRTPPKLAGNHTSPIHSERSTIIETDGNISDNVEEYVNDAMDVDQNPSEEIVNGLKNDIEMHNDDNKVKEKTSNDMLDSLPLIDESDNIFVEIDLDSASRKPDLFTKFAQHDNSSELVENFAQVKITELSKQRLRNNDPIKKFIDKVDPLNKISLKNKPISIYEDVNFKGSPQKVKDYSYTELNWFNFQLAKLAMDKEDNQEIDYCIEDFKSLCDNLSSKKIEGKEFVSVLNYLQNIQISNAEFSRYFQSLGHSLIENSLWNFFDNHINLPVSKKLSGLILLKQLLINRLRVSLDRLWNLLVGLSSESSSSVDELSLAISEAFDEMLAGLFSSEIIFARILTTLENAVLERESFSLPFILECLSKVLSTNAVSLLIDEKLIMRIDNVLSGFMNDEEVEIRRCVILSYGKLLKASRISSSIETNEDIRSEYSVMDDILKKLSIPQKKLIEYYSQS